MLDAAVTIVTESHLPHARVLAESVREHAPHVKLTVVLADGEHAARDAGIDSRELRRRAMLFGPAGLVSSLRAPAMAHVLRTTDARCVLHLDADMLALAPIGDLWRVTDGVLLSPHATAPLPGRPGAWDEELLLRAGTFNGGLLGAGRAALPFLDWLAQRTARDAVHDPERGLLYGQTWLNLVPALFPHAVLRDPTVNVTAHALGAADIDPRTLRLFHFTGFDPAQPQVLCRHLPQATLAGRPHLAELCSRYAALLRANGWPAQNAWPPVAARTRELYRDALLHAERTATEEPPDPFSEQFQAWLDAALAAAA